MTSQDETAKTITVGGDKPCDPPRPPAPDTTTDITDITDTDDEQWDVCEDCGKRHPQFGDFLDEFLKSVRVIPVRVRVVEDKADEDEDDWDDKTSDGEDKTSDGEDVIGDVSTGGDYAPEQVDAELAKARSLLAIAHNHAARVEIIAMEQGLRGVAEDANAMAGAALDAISALDLVTGADMWDMDDATDDGEDF